MNRATPPERVLRHTPGPGPAPGPERLPGTAERNAVLGLSVARAMVVTTGGEHHQEGGPAWVGTGSC